MNSTIRTVGQGLQVAFDTLQGIAGRVGHSIHSVTVNVKETDLGAGVIVGNATVNNRSRRSFKLSVISMLTDKKVVGNGVQVEFMGKTEKIAA